MSTRLLGVLLTPEMSPRMARLWCRGLCVSDFRRTHQTHIFTVPSCQIISWIPVPPTVHSLHTQANHRPTMNSFSFQGALSGHQFRHFISTSPNYNAPDHNSMYSRNQTTLKYIVALAICVVGLSYAAVPLYRVFCQASGYGGTVALAEAGDKVEKMKPVRERELTIRFNADTSASMRWQFRPQQREITVVPGETALAFYTARNTSDKPITGIATYNVVPFEAGLYFNKIQCFCFEEQRLNPNEQVDMPVFFYIDPEFNDDPAVARVDTITLSYTFFEAKEEENLQALAAPT